MKSWMQKHRRFLLVGVPLFAFLLIGIFYILGGRYVSTDDAYVQASKAAISANVPGQVLKIFVKDNQIVKKGAPLFMLDDRPYKIAVEEAKAQLINAQLQVQALKATYQQQLARVSETQQTLEYQQQEYNRQQKLAASGISSQMQLDKANNLLQSAKQQFMATQQQLANALASLGNDPNIAVDAHPIVQHAKAQLDRANLNLSYTLIAAPIDGVVTKVEQLQPGDYINAGSTVFALISNTDVWIEANFKETDITYIREGQQATIVVDAYSNQKITGYVASSSPGTGSSFSLLPPENATGNWVKIVQRVPIRIAINNIEKLPFLKPGLSASVTIDTHHSRLFKTDKND